MIWKFSTFFHLPKGRHDFVEGWLLANPTHILFTISMYLLFILKIGPSIMKNRKPLVIRKFLVVYNVFKVINSSFLAYKFLSYIVENGLFTKKCEHDKVKLYQVASLYWMYMMTKIVDLWDTIFFVIRKKYNQVSFLHVYHHTFMVLITWASLKYDPSDHWAFMACANSTIHSVMYTYYGLSALGPSSAKYLWWKKYLTLLQLIQFVLVIAHVMFQSYISKCPMHVASYWIGISNLFLFVCLFADFYKKRYRNANKKNVIQFACTKQCED